LRKKVALQNKMALGWLVSMIPCWFSLVLFFWETSIRLGFPLPGTIDTTGFAASLGPQGGLSGISKMTEPVWRWAMRQ